MPKGYYQLTYAQRCQIYILKQRRDSTATIGKELKVHRSTITRELKRNTGQKDYRYKQAQEKFITRRAKKPFSNYKLTTELIFIIEEKLRLQWSLAYYT